MAVQPKSKTPFVRMSRRYRRKAFESLRANIAQDANGRGAFTSHHMLPGGIYDGEAYDPNERSTWADFYFLSKVRAHDGLLFNATVRTVEMAVMDAAEDYMHNRIDEVLNADEHALAYPPWETRPCGDGLFELVSQKEAVFDRLGGVSLSGLRARFLLESAQHLPALHVQCELDTSYCYGVGAHFLTNDVQVNIEALAGMVASFLAHGERAYREDRAVDLNEPGLKARLEANLDQRVRMWQRIDLKERGEDVPAHLEDPISPIAQEHHLLRESA